MGWGCSKSTNSLCARPSPWGTALSTTPPSSSANPPHPLRRSHSPRTPQRWRNWRPWAAPIVHRQPLGTGFSITALLAQVVPSQVLWSKKGTFGVGSRRWAHLRGHRSGDGAKQLPLHQEKAPAEPTAAQTERHPRGFSCLSAPLHQLAKPGIVPKHRGEQMVRADGRKRHSSPNSTNKYA